MKPHVIIGPLEDPYLLRWHLIPQNKWFNIYLHKFCKDDYDEALHDHPWISFSVLLKGEYLEYAENRVRVFYAPSFIYRSLQYKHRIELPNGPAWTLFFTGPSVREWGFWCPSGFIKWKKFFENREQNGQGHGCA